MARDYTAPRIWQDLLTKHLTPGEAFTKANLFERAIKEEWEAESFLRCHGPAVALARMVAAGTLRKTDGVYVYQPAIAAPKRPLTLEERVERLEQLAHSHA